MEHQGNVTNTGLTSVSALTAKQSIYPITLVTILFFLWGFAYGLLDVLNAKFQTALNIIAAKAGGLQGGYFGAYFIGPLTYSGWLVRKFRYKWTFITGLCIYGVWAMMFWPSAVYRSFGGFCGSLFIVGSGLSTLETAANPYIATCGPPRLSDPLPEITDADMALQGEQSAGLTGYEERPMKRQYKLFFGVAAQFCYVKAQVGVAANFIKYAIGQALFAIGRFAAAGLMMFCKPRWVSMAFMTAIMIFIAAAIGTKGEGGVAILSLVLFFESCIFPTIFTLSIRGLGRHTKRGSSWIVTATSKRALFLLLTNLFADKRGYHIAMVVPLIGFLVAFAFLIYLNTVCAKELDVFRETKIGYTDSDGTIGDAAREERRASIRWEEKDTKAATTHFELEPYAIDNSRRRSCVDKDDL